MDAPGTGHELRLRLGELHQLFNAIDPAPFRERDLDPKAEEFIVGWAEELRGDGPLTLVISVDRPQPDDTGVAREAVREFFTQRAQVTRRCLRLLLRRGRTSLLIGLACLAVSALLGDLVATTFSHLRFSAVISESLLIGGWVAMWRPLEVFLYDWWPIRAEARLRDRLSTMDVRVEPHQPAN
jgi:hypothetical protein